MRLLTLLCTLTAATALGAIRQGPEVAVTRGERISEDLYAAGGTVTIDGIIDGDLVVAGGDIRIEGDVAGDVLLVGGRARVLGRIGGSLRALGAQLTLEGPVRHDVVFAGGAFSLSRFAAVGRDLLAATGRGELLGGVGRDVRALAGAFELDGRVAGRFEGQVGELTLGEQTNVGGDVVVSTDAEIRRASGAQVGGSIERRPLPRTAEPTAGLAVIGWLRSLVALLAVATIWLLLFPGFSRRAILTLKTQPGESFAFGALTLATAPIAALAVLALGVLVGGWWLSAVLLGVLVVAAAIAAPLVAHFIGELVLRVLRQRGTEVAHQGLGLVVLTALAAIPLLGALVIVITACFGIGAQVLALRGRLPVQTQERLDGLRDGAPEPTGPLELGSPS